MDCLLHPYLMLLPRVRQLKKMSLGSLLLLNESWLSKSRKRRNYHVRLEWIRPYPLISHHVYQGTYRLIQPVYLVHH